MPRAYMETILSSKPGKRRWYLAMSCGSKVESRSRGTCSASRARGYNSRSAHRPGPASTSHVPTLRLIGEPVMQALGEVSEHGLPPVCDECRRERKPLSAVHAED